MDRRRWSLGEKIAGISIGTAIVFIVTNAIAGVIGSSANNLFIRFWDALSRNSSWPWIITFITMVIGFALVLFFVWRNGGAMRNELHKVKGALDRVNQLAALDESLLRLLAHWMRATDKEGGMKLLLTGLLRDATNAFGGEVHRALIFLPDETGEQLSAWVHYQMPQESIARTVFYIGKGKDGDDRKHGVAGVTFLEGKMHIAHILHESDHWKCDRDCYINFDKERAFPPYRSLVGVPIIGFTPGSPEVSATTCLGVVCFDSQNPTFFDNQHVQTLLLALGRSIAAALLIYEQFLHPSSV